MGKPRCTCRGAPVQQRRVCLTVRGHSVAMFTLVVNMRPDTQLRLIGQELALELAEFSFVPVVAQHLPGLANTMADALSRMAQPSSCVTLPSSVKEATPVFPPVRSSAYYRTVTREVPRSWRSRGAPTQEPYGTAWRCQVLAKYYENKIVARVCQPHGVEGRRHPENQIQERRGYDRGRPELRAS